MLQEALHFNPDDEFGFDMLNDEIKRASRLWSNVHFEWYSMCNSKSRILYTVVEPAFLEISGKRQIRFGVVW